MNAAASDSPRNNELTAARLKALAFIRAEQGDSDHLPIQLFNPNRPDRTTFSSSYAALALSADSGRESLAIRRKLVTFIRSRRDWPGLWRDFGQQSLIPADLDNSALGQIVLTMHGVSCWRTDWLFYLHRHREGMFYAWMMPGNVVTLNPLYWLLALRDLTPARLHFRYFGYWKTSGKSHPRQYHIISNTHIIHYLGDTPKSSAAIDWIVDTVNTGREFEREIYYRDPEFFYLAIGRAYKAGITRFGQLGDIIERRIAERSSAEGCIGQSAFSTAAACAALLHLGRCGNVVKIAISWLTSTQEEDGGWPAAGLYYDGPPPSNMYWGSRALTTAVVVEALALFEKWELEKWELEKWELEKSPRRS